MKNLEQMQYMELKQYYKELSGIRLAKGTKTDVITKIRQYEKKENLEESSPTSTDTPVIPASSNPMEAMMQAIGTLANAVGQQMQVQNKILEKLDTMNTSVNISNKRSADYDPKALYSENEEHPIVYKTQYVVQKMVNNLGEFSSTGKVFFSKEEAERYGTTELHGAYRLVTKEVAITVDKKKKGS